MLNTVRFFLLTCLSGCLCYKDIVTESDNICYFRKCLYKCCPKNQYLNLISITENVCIDIDGTFTPDFSDIQLYDNVYHNQPIDKKISDIFLLHHSSDLNDTFWSQCFRDKILGMNSYISESGVLYAELPNAYERWTPVEKQFCIDYAYIENQTMLSYWITIENQDLSPPRKYDHIGLIISSVFLFIVLIVYALLPDLRNIGGMVLMAYVASLAGAFVTLAAIQTLELSAEDCVRLTTTIYFFFISAFSWMNVMSFDIWWTFRGYAKARPIHRRGEKFKFVMYCLYAWGVPLAMAIAFVVINSADLSHIPWFIQPNVPTFGCFLQGGQLLVYLYLPMLILILCNWMFYLLTAFNIWRLSRGTARVLNSEAAGNPAAHRTQKQRLMVYLKLSVIMGINWILEIISSFTPKLNIWMITDFYNIFIGVTIFLIFCFKKSIYNKLMLRYRSFRQYKLPKRSLTSSFTLESNLSQETPPNVCPNPKGERKRSFEQKPTFEI